MTLEIRPARPEDRRAIFAISAQVWEGHDYIPSLWESWLHDPAGPMLVAVLGGQPVGVGKIVLHGPEEAWLAGGRVDPACRGQGIATAILAHIMHWLEERHIPIARMTTASDNTPIQRMAARSGFDHVTTVRHFRRPLGKGSPGQRPRVLQPHEMEMAWKRFTHSAFFKATQGLFGLGWTWKRLTWERLQAHAERGEILAWGAGPDALGIVVDFSPTLRRVAMLVGDRAAGLDMVRALLHAPQFVVDDPEDPPQLRLTVPEGLADLDWIAQQAGLVPRWENRAMWLYEWDQRKDLPK